MRSKAPTAAGGILAAVLDRFDFRKELRVYSIWPAWREIVGPHLATRTEPLRFQRGKLFVRVANSTWMQELQLLREEVRRKINDRIGEEIVEEIYLVLGRIHRPGKAGSKPVAAGRPVDTSAVERLVPDTGHPEIDNALRRIALARARRLGPK